MAKRKTRTDHIRAAAEALSDINTFGIMLEIIEGGGILNGGYSIEMGEEIATLCKQGTQKALEDYDAAVAAANR